MKPDVMFSRQTDEWSTPQEFFDALNVEFGFMIDAAATADNCKCAEWFGPGSGWDDALSLAEWGWPFNPQPIWLNPPYSQCSEFIAKAEEQARHGNTVVCLVPSRTDTRWWHKHVWDAEKHAARPGVEIRFIKGRLKFGGSTNSAPFPSVVIIFRPVTA